MLLKPTSRIWTLVLASCIFLGTIYLWSEGNLSQSGLFPSPQSTPGAGNATLGFGAIYVLTEDVSTWRVQSLLQAAKLAGLRIEVPVQEKPSDEAVRAQVGGEPEEGYGHARALLNHLALLDKIAQSPHETALIMEDDVDFGLQIRSQMELVSKAFWDHANLAPESRGSAEEVLHPYREHEWDIFWPGHFGMSFIEGSDVFKYHDPHALPWDRLTTQFNNYYEQMAAGSSKQAEPQQLIFNVAPLATFAYAITKAHAARLVQKFRQDKTHKFDNAVHIDCVGRVHRCVAPVPQLFHHHQVVGEKASSSEGKQDESVAVQDLKWYRTRHRYTYNIEWSARCNAAGVGEKLGEKWQCLPGKYDPMM
ncbi:hypothetical protein Slin15195_G108970 [Septoria linicola]|uniref:Glycosyltransferase family 25 protein n=1 Tax=Septoria linicola TaxID=215465 RepID=A0A9Q9B281_9PEZI|nr:hypothetical protein Slin14017_G107310 [Septoria linicola]USW57578.1 hypothetical protein Slin15195_G108970 [Septoria linicola]